LAERGHIGLVRNGPTLGQSFRAHDRSEFAPAPPKPHTIWHIDETYLNIDGRMVYLWRAVDAEGGVLDVPVQSKRNKGAALKLMRKLLKKYVFVPDRMINGRAALLCGRSA
jgi:transposase-like protein